MGRSRAWKIASLFLVVLLGLAALRLYSHYNTLRIVESGRWVAHVQKVQAESQAVLSGLEDAQDAREDFGLTRDARRLAQYRDALQRIGDRMARLRAEAAGHPDDRVRVERLERLVNEELERLQRDGGVAGARPVEAPEAAEARIRAAAAEIEAEEAELLSGYLAAMRERARREFSIAVISTATVVVLLVLGYWLLLRYLRQRRLAAAEIEGLNESLRRKVEEMQVLFNLLPIGVAVADDPQCDSMRGNAALARMLGVPPERNLSSSAAQGSPPDYRFFQHGRELAPEERPMQVAAATGRSFTNVELELVRPDRRLRLCGNVVPLRDRPDGPPRGAIGTFWDAAEFLAREERLIDERDAAEAAAVAREDMLATVSHDLRTPLGATKLWATALKRGQFDTRDLPSVADQLLRLCDAQSQLIDDVLDLTRITHGKLAMEMRPITLADVVRAACETVRLVAEADGVHLNVDGDHTPDALVLGDPARLQQVFWNLLSNALKFTPKGGRVEVALRSVDGTVEVRVADTGRGIPPDALPHIFDRFWKGMSATERLNRSGLGLGLAIARHIVELHGGSISADSPGEGRGAVFSVRLPRAEPGRDRQRVELVSLGGGASTPHEQSPGGIEQSPGKDPSAQAVL